MRNRYYDPGSGRFTQEDPIGLAGGLNLYGFAGGDPVNFSDPYGLKGKRCCDEEETVGGEAVKAAKAFFGRVVDTAVSAVEAVGEVTGINDFIRAGWGFDPFHPTREVSARGRVGSGVMLVLSVTPIDDAGDALRVATPVGSALKDDVYHRAASWMRPDAASYGRRYPLPGRDGQTRQLTQLLGEVDGRGGVFEYVVDNSGNLTHQRFIPGGVVNGTINQIP